MLTLLPMIAGMPLAGSSLERLEPCEGNFDAWFLGERGRVNRLRQPRTDEDMATRSDSRRYVLLYGDVELGEVRHQDSDFPNCYGTWRPCPHADNPEIRSFIRAYVEYREHADSLMTPDFHVTPAWEAYTRYTRETEPEFEELIESTDWALRDQDGVRHGLLVPSFSLGGKIGWRWNCMSREEQHIHDTLRHGTAAEVRALRCPKNGGPLRIELCETSDDGKSHFRIRGVKSDFFFIRAFGRSPKPGWVETLGSDFVTEVSDG